MSEKRNETTPEYGFWMSLGLKSAALFYQEQNAARMERAARVFCESWKNRAPFSVERGLPSRFVDEARIEGDCGDLWGFWVDDSGLIHFDGEKFSGLQELYRTDPVASGILERAARDGSVPQELFPGRYWHCGTHKVADIPFLLESGYRGYLEKIEREERGASPKKRSFLRGMRDVTLALMDYFRRCARSFREAYERTGDERYGALADALFRVPEGPCASFREAVIVVRILNLLCDSEFGRIDQYLYPYYRKDVEQGRLTREEAKGLLADLCRFVNRDGLVWHQVVGGCGRDGKPSYNELTELVLENAPLFAHPHISLRVREDMPKELWEKALRTIGTGCGNPALVREDLFIRDLERTYGVSREDAWDFAFGGCSEIMIPGKTNVDSTWCAYNVLEVLLETVYTKLEETDSYEELYEKFCGEIEITVEEMTEHINIRQHLKGAFWPDPLLSLHTAGCIESGKGFWEGGALYNFDGADLFGNTNAVNALGTLKALYAGELGVGKERFLKALREDFKGEEELLLSIKRLPKFGNGDEELRRIAGEFTAFLFSCIRGKRTWRGDGWFVPDIVQWITYGPLGCKMGATPDGRRRATPLADSSGATPGTDENGPVPLLTDCSALPHEQGCGTLVLNMRLAQECFSDGLIGKLEDLFRGYFRMGGSQVQVSVLDEKTLQDALEHPEEHRDLIVRVGGFTDYFYRQTREIQRSIVERVAHKAE